MSGSPSAQAIIEGLFAGPPAVFDDGRRHWHAGPHLRYGAFAPEFSTAPSRRTVLGVRAVREPRT